MRVQSLDVRLWLMIIDRESGIDGAVRCTFFLLLDLTDKERRTQIGKFWYYRERSV